MKLKPINQQVVVVMGASSGIGRATALRFAAKGAAVVVAARNQKGLDAVVAEIRGKGGKAVAVVADTADAKQVKAVADRAIAEYGRLDTWAHVSGVGVYGTVEQISPQEYERLVEVNLLGQIYGALAALPHLRAEGRGVLIHVSSVVGRVPLPLSSAYTASKHGLNGFLDTLRLELQREGVPISVVNIMPASIDTPFFENAKTHLGVAPHAQPPIYAPEIVADAIVQAATLPAPAIMVGGSGAMISGMGRATPRLLQQLMLTPVGFESRTRPTTSSRPRPTRTSGSTAPLTASSASGASTRAWRPPRPSASCGGPRARSFA
jgi:NAD(P)-dependent dehydrogenase (short-subunit alcohol dehydrogenase family)